MYRKILAGCAILSLAFGAVGAAQDTGAGPIASDTSGALDVPQSWDCRRIEPEYSNWLENGNSPESWKFAGKTYRDIDTGKLYNWQDWLDWADKAGCFAGINGATTPQTGLLIGGAVTAFGAALIAVQSGSGPKSPG